VDCIEGNCLHPSAGVGNEPEPVPAQAVDVVPSPRKNCEIVATKTGTLTSETSVERPVDVPPHKKNCDTVATEEGTLTSDHTSVETEPGDIEDKGSEGGESVMEVGVARACVDVEIEARQNARSSLWSLDSENDITDAQKNELSKSAHENIIRETGLRCCPTNLYSVIRRMEPTPSFAALGNSVPSMYDASEPSTWHPRKMAYCLPNMKQHQVIPESMACPLPNERQKRSIKANPSASTIPFFTISGFNNVGEDYPHSMQFVPLQAHIQIHCLAAPEDSSDGCVGICSKEDCDGVRVGDIRYMNDGCMVLILGLFVASEPNLPFTFATLVADLSPKVIKAVNECPQSAEDSIYFIPHTSILSLKNEKLFSFTSSQIFKVSEATQANFITAALPFLGDGEKSKMNVFQCGTGTRGPTDNYPPSSDYREPLPAFKAVGRNAKHGEKEKEKGEKRSVKHVKGSDKKNQKKKNDKKNPSTNITNESPYADWEDNYDPLYEQPEEVEEQPMSKKQTIRRLSSSSSSSTSGSSSTYTSSPEQCTEIQKLQALDLQMEHSQHMYQEQKGFQELLLKQVQESNEVLLNAHNTYRVDITSVLEKKNQELLLVEQSKTTLALQMLDKISAGKDKHCSFLEKEIIESQRHKRSLELSQHHQQTMIADPTFLSQQEKEEEDPLLNRIKALRSEKKQKLNDMRKVLMGHSEEVIAAACAPIEKTFDDELKLATQDLLKVD
jgi:hypothetical protein